MSPPAIIVTPTAFAAVCCLVMRSLLAQSIAGRFAGATATTTTRRCRLLAAERLQESTDGVVRRLQRVLYGLIDRLHRRGDRIIGQGGGCRGAEQKSACHQSDTDYLRRFVALSHGR